MALDHPPGSLWTLEKVERENKQCWTAKPPRLPQCCVKNATPAKTEVRRVRCQDVPCVHSRRRSEASFTVRRAAVGQLWVRNIAVIAGEGADGCTWGVRCFLSSCLWFGLNCRAAEGGRTATRFSLFFHWIIGTSAEKTAPFGLFLDKLFQLHWWSSLTSSFSDPSDSHLTSSQRNVLIWLQKIPGWGGTSHFYRSMTDLYVQGQ